MAKTSRPLGATFELSALGLALCREEGSSSLLEQLVTQIRRAIEEGRLPAEARMPSSRYLAQQLGVSRTVVTEAYAILVAEGYLESRRGSGTYVVERQASSARAGASGSPDSPFDGSQPRWLKLQPLPPAVDPNSPGEGLKSFRVCEPDAGSFPDAAWRTCARAAVTESLPDGSIPQVPGTIPEVPGTVLTIPSRFPFLRCLAPF